MCTLRYCSTSNAKQRCTTTSYLNLLTIVFCAKLTLISDPIDLLIPSHNPPFYLSVIKQGAPANYYRDINLRIRKAIFDSLTLQKPKSLSDLQTNKWPSLYELKNMPVKSQDSARSNVPKRKGMSCISLPPISSQDKNGGKYPKRWSTQDGVNTEPVAPSRNPLKNTTPRVAKRSAEGVWY